jgi:hypothetical protein
MVKVVTLILPIDLHLELDLGSKTPTISSQIAALRNFLANSSGKTDIFGKVLSGYLPLVVECGNRVKNS